MNIHISSNLSVPCICLILITKKPKEMQSYFRPTWTPIYCLLVFESRSSSCVVHAPLPNAKTKFIVKLFFQVHPYTLPHTYICIYNQLHGIYTIL